MPGKAPVNYLTHLLRLSALRYAFQHPWQLSLSFIGIMLGVMMVVSVDLANSSARRAFSLSVESVTGTITHQIVGGSEGVADDIFTSLRTELGIRRSAPNLSGQVVIDGQQFTLLGIDPLSESSLQRQRPGFSGQENIFASNYLAMLSQEKTILLNQSVADLLSVAANDSLTIVAESNELEMTALLAASSNSVASEGIVLVDIAMAQVLLGSIGKIDSIDLIVQDAEVELIQAWLPSGLSLINAQTRNDALQQMTEAFHVNLLAMSLLSLLVGGLLIYNTVTLSVIQRQKTLGIFRSQGVSRQQIFRLILGEAALLGSVASVAGVVLGYGLGQLLVRLVTRTINDIYFSLNVSSFIVDPFSLLKGFLLGIVITVLSASLPAWRATHCLPVTLQQRSVQDGKWHKNLPRIAFAGISMMLMGWMLLSLEQASLVQGFISLTLIIFGFCFLVPTMMSLLLSRAVKLFSVYLGVSSTMALRNVQAGISRTGLAVAALTVAISVTVGVGIMVGSFRQTVIIWLDQSLGGHVQISVRGEVTDGLSEQLAQLQVELYNLENIKEVSGTIHRNVETEFAQVRLQVSELSVDQNYYLKEFDAQSLQRFEKGEGILISEPFAYQYQLRLNDKIEINTDKGPQDFLILGIFYDYTSSAGMLGLHRTLYQQWWNDLGLSRLTISLQEPVAINRVFIPELRRFLNNSLGNDQPFMSISNQQLKQITLEIFDRTFAITNVLRLLSLLVAFVGVLSALMALQLERLREFAILRATGMTPKQIAIQVFSQTAVMGLLAGLLALPLGLIMSEVLIDVINKRSFGWSMQHLLPLSVLIEALVLAVLAALCAGVYPAFKATKITPAAALREE